MASPPQVPAVDEDLKKDALPNWLVKLQNESWQAEILISGGAFVGLGSVIKVFVPLFQFLFYSTFFNENLINRAAMSINLIVASLMLGFLIHLVLRGFWIGLVGMNYVFPNGINTERLAMKGKFKSMFRESQNTSMIIRLDKICGAIFAITFVWLFSCIGIVVSVSLIILVTDESTRAHYPWINILTAIFFLIGALTLIDFLSAGRLKRIKWLAVVYYPVHSIVSILTLSFIYRRLYYTVVSNTRWIYTALLFSIPLVLMICQVTFSYVKSDLSDNIYDVHGGYENPENPSFLSIRDPVIYDNFLEVKLLHIARLEEPAFAQWKNKNPDNRAAHFGDLDAALQSAILSQLYQLEVDEKKMGDSTRWMIYLPRLIEGPLFPKIKMTTVLDISNLTEGSHVLTASIRLDSSILLNQKQFNGRYAKVHFYFHKGKENKGL